MTEEMDPASGSDGIDCRGAQALARQAIIAQAGEPLARTAEAHLRSCPDCRAEVDEITRVDAILSGALGSVRRRIPPPTPREIDVILAGVEGAPSTAKLLSRFRRSVNRMLWFTLLVLSFLIIGVVAWALLHHLKLLKGG